MAKTFDGARELGKFLRSMLSKEVSIPEKHTQPDNLEKIHPFCQVAFDITKPLAESSGNKYIPLNGDQFIKWYEAIPMSNQEASTVAEAFVNVCVSRFGCPANLHSDKGSNFMSNRMCKELEINRTSTTVNHLLKETQR